MFGNLGYIWTLTSPYSTVVLIVCLFCTSMVLKERGKYNCVGDDVSLSVIKRYSEYMCVCLEKGKRYWLWTQVRQLCLPCHYCCWISTERGKKNNPLEPLLLQLLDKGLSFLQTLWRHSLSKGLGKLYKSREVEGKPLPLPFSLPSTGHSSIGVPEMKWFSVCSAYTASFPVQAQAQILS